MHSLGSCSYCAQRNGDKTGQQQRGRGSRAASAVEDPTDTNWGLVTVARSVCFGQEQNKTVVAVNAPSARVTEGVPINNTLSL